MASGRLNPVAWTEGMFLRPQHFQQHDVYLEERLRYHLHALNPHHWGVRELVINEDALADNRFEIQQIEAVMPGGTISAPPSVVLQLQSALGPNLDTVAYSVFAKVEAEMPFPVSGAQRIPPAPSFQRRKRPSDVFMRLIHCTELVRSVMGASGMSTFEIVPGAIDNEKVRPSDVFDIASLLVAELQMLHRRMTSAPLKHASYAPGRKFPSHVYQRAGILEAQLLELKKRAEADRGWLKRGK